jgi:alkaline phosphatase D
VKLLVCVGGVLLLIASLTTGAAAQEAAFPDGIAVGDVVYNAATVWTRTQGPADVRIQYATNPGFAGARTAGPVHTGPGSDFTVKISLRNLRPGQRYYARPTSRGVRGPTASFVTPPPPGRAAPLTLIWGGDTIERRKPFRIFDTMRSRNADLFLYLGNTIYADRGIVRAVTLDEYRQEYRRNREDAALRACLATTAAWVIWNDHEVENNFNSAHPRLAMGRQAFLEYWPIRTSPAQPTRLYRSVRWGRTAELFVLDTRQYRSQQMQPDGPGKTMLGRAQKAWLLDALARSGAAVKLVASSVPLRYHSSDSWEGYAHERGELLRFIRDHRIRNVVFLSGDAHYAALLHHPEGVYEAIAGPLAATPAQSARARGKPATLWAAAGRSNYGAMHITGEQIVVEWWNSRDRLVYKARIPIER